MRKWLVGLLAAGLCAATALADGVATLPVAENYTSTQDWTALTGFSGSGVGTYADGRCKFDSNNDWLMVQFDGAPAELTFDVKGNTASGTSLTSPASFLVEESADAETWTQVANLDETAFSTDYASFGPFTLAAESRYVRWTYANKYGFNLGLNNVAIGSGGPVAFALSLDPSEDFTVVQGKSATITANVRGAQGDVTYSWSVNGTPIDLAGNVYTVDSAELGEYEVAVEVSDGVAEALSASVKYTVVEAPVVTGDVLTRETTGVSGTSYKDWTATGDSGAEYAGNSAGGNDSIQMRTTNPSGIVITKSSGKDVASVTVEWNDATAAEKRSLEIYGSTEAYAGPAALYEASTKGELLGTIARDGATLEIPEGYPYVGILAKGGAVYLTSVAFEFAGASGPSVSLSASATEVEVNEPVTITATAKNFSADVEWAWEGNDGGSADGAVYTVNTAVAGEFTIKATATAGDEIAEKSVTITVSEPAQKYAVNVALGIQNGAVTTDVSEAAEGDPVTVTATPADGYRLVEIIVNNGEVAVTGNAFVMPAQDVLVTATFEEKPPVTGDVLTNDDVGSQTSSYKDWTAEKESGAVYAGQTAGGSATNPCIQLRTTQNNSGIVMTKDSGQNVSSVTIEWNAQSAADRVVQVYGSTTPYSSPADLYGDAKGTLLGELANGSGEVTVDVAAAGEFPYVGIRSKSGAIYLTSVAIDFGGAAAFSITLDPAKYFEVEVGEEASIAATPKNAEGEVHYAWTVGGEPAGSDSAVLGLDTTAATEEIEVVCTATDAADTVATASVSYKVVAPAPKYAVNVALGIQNGTVTTDVSEAAEGDPVTVTATPADGYRLVEIIVNNGEVAVTGNTFVMPAQDVLVTATFEEKPPVTGDVLTNDDVGSQTSSYKDWTAEKESGAVYAGQTAGGSATNPCIQLRTTQNNSGIVMTKDSGQNVSSVTIEWNAQSAADRVVQVYGSTTPYSSPADLYGDAKGTLLGELTNGSGEVTVDVAAVGEFPYIGIRSKSGAIYLTSVAIDFGGAVGPSIAYTGETEKTLPDAAFELVFTLRNYEGDFSWSLVEGEGTLGEGGVYTWTATDPGDYTIKVAAINGELQVAPLKEVTLKVNPQLVTYPITVEQASGGTIAVDKETAEAGETVTVTATADDGMRLVAITVNGSPIEGKSFEMPAEPVTVSATFEEFEVPPYYFQFESNDLPTAYSATEANVANTGSTAEEVPTVPFALQRAVRGNASGDKTVGAAALRLAPIGETNAFAYNSAAFSEAITAISFQYGIYGTSDKCDSFTVSTSEDGEEWTVLADLTATATGELQTFESSDLPDNTLFIRFDATNTVAGNSRRMDIDEIQLWTGAPSPKIVYSGETSIALGDSFEIIFGLLNYDGDFTWEMGSREGGTIVPDGRDGLYTWTPSDPGVVTITVVARSSDAQEIATKDVVLTVTEPGPQPGDPAIVFGGDTEGVVGQVVNFTVTAVNISDPTVYSEGFQFPDNSSLADGDITIDFPNVSFTPDVVGGFTFLFSAGEGDEYAEGTLTITVTDGPGPQPGGFQITGLAKTGDSLVLTFAGEGTPAVLGTASLASPQEWTPVEGATVSGNSATVPMGAQNYIRLQ